MIKKGQQGFLCNHYFQNKKVVKHDKGAGIVRIKRPDTIAKLKNKSATQGRKRKTQHLRLQRNSKQHSRTYISKVSSQMPNTRNSIRLIPPRMYGVVKAHKPEKGLPYVNCGLDHRHSILQNIRISC